MTDPKSEVAGVVERFLDAVSREDRQGIRAHHAQNVLMFDFPNTVRGIAEYEKTWDFFFASRRGPITFSPSGLQASANDGVGFVTCEVHCDGTTAGPLDFRLTVGLVKRGGHWEIAHEHHSLATNDEPYIPKETRATRGS
jgi:ketosteroid isomerase-like protein